MLTVRETIKWAGKYVQEHGPLFVEASTYRYHGHSMSDPGVSYRDKAEIAEIRASRDPLEICRGLLVETGWATAEECKDLEKRIRKRLDDEVA